jgi:hypothetical protein
MKYLKVFEAKRRIDPLNELKEDIQLVFAYIIDENPNISIERKTGGIITVSFPKVLPTVSTDVDDFSNKLLIMHSLLESVTVGCIQLIRMKENLEHSIKLFNNENDTSIMIDFWFNTNTTVFKINPSSIVISKINLFRTLGFDKNEWTFGSFVVDRQRESSLLEGGGNSYINRFTFSFSYKTDYTQNELEEILEKMSELFSEHFIFINVITQWQRPTQINQTYKLITLKMVYKDPTVKKSIIVRDLV